MTKDQKITWLESQVDFLSRNYVTGLQGRHIFMQNVRKRFNSPENFKLAMYDVDGLHEVNRVSGYGAGDSLLREVANDLKLCEEPCAAYHIGGDEFYVIYCDTPKEFKCLNTTSVLASSADYKTVDEMLDSLDAQVSAKKLKTKKRRRTDI